AAEPERIDPADLREEALVADDPARRELGVPDALEIRAERAVLVRADRGSQEQPVMQRDRLLEEEPERLRQRRGLGEVIRRDDLRARLRSRWKLGAAALSQIELVVDVLRTDGRARVDPGPRIEVRATRQVD